MFSYIIHENDVENDYGTSVLSRQNLNHTTESMDDVKWVQYQSKSIKKGHQTAIKQYDITSCEHFNSTLDFNINGQLKLLSSLLFPAEGLKYDTTQNYKRQMLPQIYTSFLVATILCIL